MKTLFSRLITVIACFFIFSAAWFCLWSISLHLVERPDMAVLLFPFGLRLGLMRQCPRGYWPVLLGAEWLYATIGGVLGLGVVIAWFLRRGRALSAHRRPRRGGQRRRRRPRPVRGEGDVDAPRSQRHLRARPRRRGCVTAAALLALRLSTPPF